MPIEIPKKFQQIPPLSPTKDWQIRDPEIFEIAFPKAKDAPKKRSKKTLQKTPQKMLLTPWRLLLIGIWHSRSCDRTIL